MKNGFSEIIMDWYQDHKRDLPWRSTKDPYRIWLSEIILQQTRVAQGLPYFKHFVEKYPSVHDLAKASEQDILKVWQGLGYYSRARNLHTTAQYVSNTLKGIFPKTYEELLKLKGVGDYTASAIASFAYNLPTPTIDGNVFRVLARFFGIATPINSSKAKKEFKDLARELIDLKDPSVFNQAIMEFGALQCTPKSPDCMHCPLSDACVALQKNQVSKLPKKDKKTKIKNRFLNYLVVHTSDQKTVLTQRKEKGIWRNLYQFPLVETEKEIGYKDLFKQTLFQEFTKDKGFTLTLFYPKTCVHKLSHQHLHIQFWVLSCGSWDAPSLSWQEVQKYPVPIVIHNFIEDFVAAKI